MNYAASMFDKNTPWSVQSTLVETLTLKMQEKTSRWEFLSTNSPSIGIFRSPLLLTLGKENEATGRRGRRRRKDSERTSKIAKKQGERGAEGRSTRWRRILRRESLNEELEKDGEKDRERWLGILGNDAVKNPQLYFLSPLYSLGAKYGRNQTSLFRFKSCRIKERRRSESAENDIWRFVESSEEIKSFVATTTSLIEGLKCFRPDPVCGEDDVTYWCGCSDAHRVPPHPFLSIHECTKVGSILITMSMQEVQ
ncbi:hypothetical protein V2J09_020726 [Rumex salicifolius]